jgi:glutamate-1-semialdehyde 2,1-aminomutase
MSALRLARAATRRAMVVKFDGCYHGHADHLLVAAGSGCATLGQPDSAGVPASFAAKTASVPYNDLVAVEQAFAAARGDVAAVIVEPVAGNMGLVLPAPGFLAGLRALCDREGALLVFDEVMTGFRTAWGGWQTVCGVRPDLTCLGKVVGGGLPVGAYGGARALMRQLAPEGPCYQAGTLSGNPVAMAAGLACLGAARRRGFHDRLAAWTTTLVEGLRALAADHRQAVQFAQAGSMWGYFFSAAAVSDYAAAARSDSARWATFCAAMVEQGVYLAPSPFEAAFTSAAHGKKELDHTLRAAGRAFARTRRLHG